MKELIKIGLVDDHPMFRHALADLIGQANSGFKVVVEVSNGQELIAQLGEPGEPACPEIIIMDINNPVMDGFKTTEWLRKQYPSIKIIVLSLNDDEASVMRMVRLGVQGYLVKTVNAPALFSAIAAVAKNEFYFASFKSAAELSACLTDGSHTREIWNSLDDQEKHFVRLCCTDINYRELAGKMGCNTVSVETCRENVFLKFRIRSRVALTLLATRYELVES